MKNGKRVSGGIKIYNGNLSDISVVSHQQAAKISFRLHMWSDFVDSTCDLQQRNDDKKFFFAFAFDCESRHGQN